MHLNHCGSKWSQFMIVSSQTYVISEFCVYICNLQTCMCHCTTLPTSTYSFILQDGRVCRMAFSINPEKVDNSSSKPDSSKG